jgi:hypothetical protein
MKTEAFPRDYLLKAILAATTKQAAFSNVVKAKMTLRSKKSHEGELFPSL